MEITKIITKLDLFYFLSNFEVRIFIFGYVLAIIGTVFNIKLYEYLWVYYKLLYISSPIGFDLKFTECTWGV